MNSNWRRSRLVILPFAAGLVLLAPSPAHGYIGPGAGFAVVGSFLVMLTAFLSALLALVTWPLRYAIRAVKGRKAFARSRIRKFVILGLDGMEPSLAERMLAEGKLPHLDKLRRQGCYKKLATTLPPLSPVAWSSFQTGCNPGKHNIFDFLTRDKHTYAPKLSSVEIKPAKRMIKFGKYQIPLGSGQIRLLRMAKPFWKFLGDHGVFSNVIRVPITFPPEKFYGVSLSAMCVPDLRGSQGMFSFYTTRADSGERTGGEYFRVERNGSAIRTHLVGPENPFYQKRRVMECPFTVSLNGQSGQALLKINGKKIKLQQDVYTEWTEINFKAAPGVKVRGICQFLLLGTEPEFELYVTPINISPDKPAMPIAHPGVYATYLAKSQGPYATLGLAEDSWALNEKILSETAFLHQCIQADEEREVMYFDAIDKVKRGLCVCVFDGTDRIQHTFWRYLDPDHPAHGDLPPQKQHEHAIEELYQRMDGIVGKTLEKCDDENTVIMVISDHGFNSFRYGIDLNRWLEENGYLKLKDGDRGQDYLAGADWSGTQAFAVGLAGIYLNIKGREAQGIVEPGGEADQLRDEIAEKLSGLKHTDRDEVAIRKVYNALKTYHGPYKGEAPDLIVGYNKGYRVSWETAVGRPTDSIFHDNVKAWTGDHCIDPSLVPGVLFCNRAIADKHPRLMDIAPTALDLFGVPVPSHMDGAPLKIADAQPPEPAKDKS